MRFALFLTWFALGSPALQAATHAIAVDADGSFSPARVEIASGDTVEWRFATRTSSIIPVKLATNGQPDCANPLPYDLANPNEFTGPLPRAISGIFTLSPEEAPYTSQDATWTSDQFTGVFIRPRWDEVHLGPGQFDWTNVDREMDKAVRNGKLFSIGFKAGVKGTPLWIFDGAKTDAPVTPLDFGLKSEGKPALYGSPADANYKKHFFDLLRALAAHLRLNNARYRALAYIKISGLNLHTHENRLPNETTQDLATWTGSGKYTPAALLQFYHEQTALLAAEFPNKDMSFALIQDGFPQINDQGEYLGQPTPPKFPIPSGADQTEAVLRQGRLEHGLRFVVQHNGLQEKPEFCPGSGVHPTIIDPKFRYVGSGCPNRWVLAESLAGQVTGFQDVAGFTTTDQLESSLQNEWDNSDGIFLEIYEGIALQSAARPLPSGLTLADWTERFHARRRTNLPQLPDPFPLTHRHTFTGTSGGPQTFHFIDGAKCSGASIPFGTVVIQSGLRFTGIKALGESSVQLTLNVARAGTLWLESSEDLVKWGLIESRVVSSGITISMDTRPTPQARYYRAFLQ